MAKNRTRGGFTLLELAVVVLVLGILAGMAVMRMNNASGDARNAAALQTLEVLRNAIELYRAEHGEFPGQSETSDGFKEDLKPYLRGEFPSCLVGNNNADVRMLNPGGSNTILVSGPEGWAYSNQTGKIIINHDDYGSY